MSLTGIGWHRSIIFTSKISAVSCCRTPVLRQLGFNLFAENLTKKPMHCVGSQNCATHVGGD